MSYYSIQLVRNKEAMGRISSMKISDLVRTEPVTTIGRRRTGTYQATFLDADETGLVIGKGTTRSEAEADLLEGMRASLRGDSTPCVLIFRGETIVIWHYERFWIYGFLRDTSTPRSVVMGRWSRNEAERQARRHLAQSQWDGHEETSPIIICDADQQEFTAWARLQKTYKRLCAHGWDHDEALNIVSGLTHLLAPSRIKELGDPSILLSSSMDTIMR
jgi:hypothetical protein